MINKILKSSFHEKLKMLLIAVGLVVTSLTTQAWAADAAMYLIGNPIGDDWSASTTTYRIQTAYGQNHKYYLAVYIEKNQYLALTNGSTRYAPDTNGKNLGGTGLQGDYNHTGNAWQYTGSSGLKKVCISQDGLNDTYYPYVWIEDYWNPADEINAVLKGEKIMFYYGDQWGGGYKYLFDGSGHSNQASFWLTYTKGSFYVNNTDWGNFRWGVAAVAPNKKYYVSNTSGWDGLQMGANAAAGQAYMLYTDGGNKLATGTNRNGATFTRSSYTMNYGTAASGVSATKAYNTSVIGKTNTLTYYITSDNTTYTTFNPNSAGSLMPGTYTIKALVSDGFIYVVGATATLTVNDNSYNATVSAGANGSVSPSGTVGIKQANGTSITATANDGYYFTNWTISGGGITPTSSSSATQIFKATSTGGSLTANFGKRWVLRGSRPDGSPAEGMPSWSTTTADMTVSSGTSTKTVTLLPNRKYKYMIYDKKSSVQRGCTSDQEVSATQPWNKEWTLNGTNPVYFSTKGYGTYTFSVVVGTNDKPAVTISGPTSRTISMGTITWSEGVATPAASAGGTNTAKTTENSVDYAITNGQYIRNGGTAVFTATPNSGYQFMGWFNSSSYNPETQEPISVENPYTISNITSNKTVYALFKEIVFDVTVKLDGTTPTTLKVGKVSHPSITASVPTGKVFDRWVITGSATVDDSANPTTTITGASDNQSTVTATFKDLPKIYIDLNAATDWRPSNMYVYFYSGGYWDSSNGTGANSGGTLIKANCPMTKITGTNIWYCEYNPNASPFAGKTITHVTFSDQSRTSGYFNSCTAVYRTDFDACMNMFVLTDNTYTKYNSQNCAYRNTNQISGDANKGYWRNYGEKNSGFYLNNLNGGSFEFTNEDGGNTYSTLVNLEKNKTYYFYIGGCGGQNWSNNQGTYPFNTNNRTRNVIKYNDVSSDGNRCKLTTTEAGYYTFKLTPSNTAAQMSVTIDFPINSGDYRATVTHSGKEFPSNTIKSGMSSGTISLYLKQGSNTLSIQKYNGTKWVQQITRTVSPSKNGVYTMTLTCNNASSTVSTPEAYEGEFYIRTDCAPGGWRDYTENKMTYNELTFSESDATTFDYYFCKWISSSGYNVRFVVGNEINMAISDTLIHDAALGSGTEEVLPAPANVRFSYNSYTNEVKRAYISGATNPNDRFLIMHTNNKVYTSTGAAINYHSTYSNLIANEAYFYDRNNWVYYVELQAQTGSTAYLTAHYNGADRDLYGSSGSPKPVLTSSNNTTKYNILVTYDFKTNNLLTAWHPGANATVNDDITSIPSVMFIRKHQEQADQVTIGSGSVAKSTIYGVMKFNKYILNNQSESGEHAPTSLSDTERDLYWISFPFDVNLSDVFGFGEYGKHWIIEEYDGAERAAKGYWKDSPGFWKFVTDRSGKVLKKGKGYVLALDLDELRISSDIWNNNVTDVYLYFPSTEKLSVENVKASDITEVPAHTCTINRQKPGDVYDINKNRTIADSHWNLIGVPLFANSTGFTFSANYYYAWNCATNTYSTESATTGTLQTMQAYMVQFAGTLDWYSHTTTNAIVGRRAEAEDEHFAEFKVALMQGEESLDHAFVRLSDEDEVTTNFEFGYDLCKEFNGSKANIYTIAENYIPVAGNCLPLSLSQTTSVPLGVRIESEGEYIFSMPEGTKGVGVTLIDNETGTRTNLGLTDYAVTLPAGDYNNRFVLEISPIEHTTTAIENSEKTDAPNNVCKKLIDGVLYIIKDGKVFDARGARLQ